MPQVFSNYFETRFTEELDVGATTVTVQSVANMPTITGDEYFYLTIHSTTTREIVKVTNVDTPSLTLTIERGLDGTTALTWPNSSKIAFMVCRIMLNEIKSDAEAAAGDQTLVHLSTVEIDNDTSIDFTDPSLFDGTYKRLIGKAYNIEGDTNHQCGLRVSIDGGSTFISSNYKDAVFSLGDKGSWSYSYSNTSRSYCIVNAGYTVVANKELSFTIEILNPFSTSDEKFFATSFIQDDP
ncbi:MAG: hypothetical protein NE330_05840, partial [Lentisphaeraceae bacterium]|nr:hypothetical protein [Lentisphaeraceae bacterium]